MKRWPKKLRDAFVPFTIWLAILSLLATVHADVFEQERVPIGALFTAPIQRLNRWQSPESLSLLLPSSNLPSGHGRKPSLYIFMVDVSSSMTWSRVSKQEMARYFEEINAEQIRQDKPHVAQCLSREGGATGFDIARSEACRYIDSLPVDSQAALWTFGTAPHLVVPDEASPNGERFIQIKDNDGGGNTRLQFFPAIQRLKAKESYTNFERLLEEVAVRYGDIINDDEREVHFVLISDFEHDIGGEDLREKSSNSNIDDLKDSLLESQYRVSLSSIGKRLQGMSSRSGKTFHFAVVRGSRRAICSILPVAGKMVSWDAYREIRIDSGAIGSDFDFLNSYQELAEPITFYYTPGGSEPDPVSIRVDGKSYVGAKLRVGLASRSISNLSFPLSVRVTFHDGEGGELSTRGREGRVVIGEGFVGEIVREKDEISLQPEAVIDPREASTYRLLFSSQGNSAAEQGPKRTFAARVVFKRQLSLYGAIAMAFSMAAVAFFLLKMIFLLLAPAYHRFTRWRGSKRSPSFPREEEGGAEAT